MATEPEDQTAITAIAALSERLRRDLYRFIRAARGPVSRDEAAQAVGISRKLAAFHLDKLVDAGLLQARYESVGGIRRVGRAPKVYEPADVRIRVSIPEQRYDVLADILTDAVLTSSPEEDGPQSVARVAAQHGRSVGAAERQRVKPGRLGAERALTLAADILARYGFEPARASATCLQLANCPFQPQAAKAPHLICGLNHAFLSGLLAGLQAASVGAVLTPHPDRCCVELRPATGG